jgi:hypothetical protein
VGRIARRRAFLRVPEPRLVLVRQQLLLPRRGLIVGKLLPPRRFVVSRELLFAERLITAKLLISRRLLGRFAGSFCAKVRAVEQPVVLSGLAGEPGGAQRPASGP